MSGAEIFALYGAPWVLVAGAALIYWRNHVLMLEAHRQNRAQSPSEFAHREAGNASLELSQKGEGRDLSAETMLSMARAIEHLADPDTSTETSRSDPTMRTRTQKASSGVGPVTTGVERSFDPVAINPSKAGGVPLTEAERSMLAERGIFIVP